MVVHVQERQLLPSLLEDNEHSVGEVQNLGDVEHVQDEHDGGVLLVEGVAGKDVVIRAPSLHQGLNTHVRAKHDLHDVVQELQGVKALDRGQQTHDGLHKREVEKGYD